MQFNGKTDTPLSHLLLQVHERAAKDVAYECERIRAVYKAKLAIREVGYDVDISTFGAKQFHVEGDITTVRMFRKAFGRLDIYTKTTAWDHTKGVESDTEMMVYMRPIDSLWRPYCQVGLRRPVPLQDRPGNVLSAKTCKIVRTTRVVEDVQLVCGI